MEITNEVFADLCEQLYEHRTKEKDGKHPSYTKGSPNRLANFDNIARDSQGQLTPEMVLFVYMKKHWDAVVSALLDPAIPQGEPIIGRIGDLMNYLELAYAMIRRREGAPGVMQVFQEEVERLRNAPPLARV